MKSVVRAAALALGLACAGFAARPADAQEEADDVVVKKDGSRTSGKIESEDMKGCVIVVSKAKLTISWGQIKSVDYAGPLEFKTARRNAEAGNTIDAIPALEKLRGQDSLRALLKPHVLNLLGMCYTRSGEWDKGVEAINDLFTKHPNTQFQNAAGENLVQCQVSKGDPAGAMATLEKISKSGDTSGLGLLKGRVKEALKDYAGAAGEYKNVLDTAKDDATKAAAELGMARCLFGQGKGSEAEQRYRGLVQRDLPNMVLAGAWNGLGDIMKDQGFQKKDADVLTDALFCYMRGSVQYTPQGGDPTAEYERAIKGSAECFRLLSEVEKDETRKKAFASRARDRLEFLQAKFPNSTYLSGK